MNRLRIGAIVLFASVFSLSVIAQEATEGVVATLENGEQVVVPKGMTLIPGQPLVLSEKDMAQVATAKAQLDKWGYVDRPGDQPIAKSALTFLRGEFEKKAADNARAVNVVAASAFDFSKIHAGKVSPDILNSKTEAYVVVTEQDISRVYANTAVGDIYINEMVGARMGVIGGAGTPNMHIAGFQGYKTTVRYADGQMATVVLIPTSNGVTMIEIGSTFEEQRSTILQELLTTLVTDRQG